MKLMSGYEKASSKVLTSLAFLNFGQTAIFTIGLTICMLMSGIEVSKGNQTIGDFVLVNALFDAAIHSIKFFWFYLQRNFTRDD